MKNIILTFIIVVFISASVGCAHGFRNITNIQEATADSKSSDLLERLEANRGLQKKPDFNAQLREDAIEAYQARGGDE